MKEERFLGDYPCVQNRIHGTFFYVNMTKTMTVPNFELFLVGNFRDSKKSG